MNCHPSECYQTCNFGAVSMQHIFFQPASFSFSTLFFLGGYTIFLASCSLTFTGANERTLLIFENIGLYLMRTSLSGHAQLPPANLSCYGLKKIYTRNLVTKKNSCGSKIPLPPLITFLIVRPLCKL